MAKSSVKFRDSEASYASIMQDISARKFSPIYLLMGEESYFIDRVADALQNSILSESERAFNQIVIYGKDSDGGTVSSYCRQLPMMGSYEVIIVREAQALQALEKLSVYTAKPQNSTILVICHKTKSVDRRSQLYKTCLQNGCVLESVPPRDYEIGPWLDSLIRSKELQFSQESKGMLLGHLGTDMQKIENEIDKLKVALPEGTREITPQEIENYIGISKEFNAYELSRAVAQRDIKRAMLIADMLSRNPKENPLLRIVMILFGTFREIFIINYLEWCAKHKGQPFPSDQQLAAQLGTSPFMVREPKANAKLWNNRKVFQILGLMREYDAKSKGIDSGGQSNAELLRELLLKIFN